LFSTVAWKGGKKGSGLHEKIALERIFSIYFAQSYQKLCFSKSRITPLQKVTLEKV
jgi:hypothetical protein